MRKLLLILLLAPLSAFGADAASGTMTADGTTNSAGDNARISCPASSEYIDVSVNYTSGTGTIEIQYFHDISGFIDIPEGASFTASFKKKVYEKQVQLELSSASSASIEYAMACR